MNHSIFDAIETGSYTASEAVELDAMLSKVIPSEVPDDQVKSMIDYIDFRFLHEAVAPSLQDDLRELHQALSDRQFAA
ncbi:hypothetical protein JWH04_15340 [Xanthomonas melonis]|uniref:hypothetical protein n=1 Tax=Xanthomonas melonis TaxID=56456 RepID=UPI001E4B29CF|nr:hypothetical protein [Xanthomonas melonis]MCD0280286.1 hypothetical protein [Xanthomonas melonis]